MPQTNALQPEPPLVPYRTPGTLQRVRAELEKSDLVNWTSIAVKLGIGIPLCLLGPLLVTAILKFSERAWEADVFPRFGLLLLIVSLLLLPLLFWLDRRTNGQFFAEAHVGETDLGRAHSRGEWELRQTEALSRAYTEIALTGPRLTREAFEQLRGKPMMDQPLRMVAAEVAAELYDAGEGVAVKSLLRPDRPAGVLLPAIRHLKRLDWVGLSAKRDRIWLSSVCRERLRQAG